MTFDSLRPKRDLSDFATLSMTANGPELHAVPPSFTTGPPTTEIAGNVRLNLRASGSDASKRPHSDALIWPHPDSQEVPDG